MSDMPKDNPSRSSQGGSVPGFTRSAATNGEGIEVAVASFDPGYTEESKYLGEATDRIVQADLIRGYIATGRLVNGRG
jgi:hypothetical protein